MPGKKAPKTRPKKSPAPPAAAKRTSNQPDGKPAATAVNTNKKSHPKKALSPLEVQLRKTLAEMGLARARRVFAAVEASFDD